jgi:hypothetical protein
LDHVSIARDSRDDTALPARPSAKAQAGNQYTDGDLLHSIASSEIRSYSATVKGVVVLQWGRERALAEIG